MLLELINNILQLAKLEAGKTEVQAQDFSIDQLVDELYDMIRPLAEKKHLDLHLEIEPNIPSLFQDQGKTRQILTNLLSNAIKFTPEGGRIKTSILQDGDNLVIQVKDSGVGIAEDDRKIVFEKFRQAPFYDRYRFSDATALRHRVGIVYCEGTMHLAGVGR